jgi:ABC-2 type transport system ATP-binding protein
MNDENVAIRVVDVSKRFVIRKEKSLKERLVNLGRSRLHKSDFYALRDVSLDIQRGTTIGLIGPNGSGKSTLLKTIGGIMSPSTGEVQHRGRVAALLELGAGFHPDLTGRENVYLNASILGMSKEETDDQLADILEFSGIGDFIDTQVKFYSSGMYVRLAFSVAVHVDPDILIVDEVLAVGDEPFQRKCMDRIREFQRQGKTIVLVTHSMEQVAQLCDRAIVLEKGNVVFDGEPGQAIRRLRSDFEEARLQHVAEAEVEAVAAPATINGVQLTAIGGGPVDTLPSGSGIVIDVALTVAAPTDDWVVGVGIETALGQVIFSTSTRRMGTPIEEISGEAVFRFELESLALGKGQYAVWAMFGTRTGGEVARLPQAATFSVEELSNNSGVLSAQATVEILQASETRLA